MANLLESYLTSGSEHKNLFEAHTPQKNYLSKMCKHYYCNFLSIAKLIRKPENEIIPFRHIHDAYEFLIPLNSTPLIMQEGAIYFGEVGYIYPIMANRPHGVQIKYNDISNYNITVSKEIMERRMAEKGLANAQFNSRFEMTPQLNSLIRLFIDEFEKGQVADVVNLNLLGILIVSTLVENGCRPELADRRKPTKQYQKGIIAVVQYIDQHFAENLTIDELASISGFTRNYFISSFKKMTGDAPYEHIKKLRISKAKIILQNTELSIADVAAECGFLKASSFASLFKSETGTSPSEYRRSIRNSTES